MHSYDERVRSFALALFSIAKEENKVDKFLKESIEIKKGISQNPKIINILNSLDISFGEKEKTIRKIFKGANKNIINFLNVLCKKRYFFQISNILDKFIKLCLDEKGIKYGIAYSSEKLSLKQLKKIEEKASFFLHKKVFLKNILDKELIVGIKVEIDNQIIEYSIKSQLKDIANQLKGGN